MAAVVRFSVRGAHARCGPVMRAFRRVAVGKAARAQHAAKPRADPGGETGPITVVLFDAENISSRYLPQVLDAVQRNGNKAMVRAFGPTSLMSSPQWKNLALAHGVDRVLCDGCKSGKNSADISLAVDAMDLLANGLIETFVIVSGDTDFAPVIQRLHKAGKRVCGMGIAAGNLAYRNAYDEFTVMKPHGKAKPSPLPAKKSAKKPAKLDEATVKLLLECARDANAPDSWCDVSQLCVLVRKQRPNFSAKQYGCKNVTRLIEKTGQFDVRRTRNGSYVRPRVA